jgi:hypothetical protein
MPFVRSMTTQTPTKTTARTTKKQSKIADKAVRALARTARLFADYETNPRHVPRHWYNGSNNIEHSSIIAHFK